MKKTVLIEEMPWQDFARAIALDDTIIIPVGSTEEHGPQSPLGTDFFIARALARAIGEKSGAMVAPAIPIGNAEALLDFPGTISIDPAILGSLVYGICENFIRHGAGHFFFVNGHGGNTMALRHAASDLFAKYGVFISSSEWWVLMPKISRFNSHDHGGKFETSMMMAIDESLVDLTRADTKQIKKLTEGISFDYGFYYRGANITLNIPTPVITPNGNFGDPSEEAEKSLGLGMFEAYTDYCADLVKEIRSVPVRPVQGGIN
ncbi:MAG: creatininase family protein [Spirochaetaceae bacterium]|jgi:creatinine amidohydrolase|nr:creatininase family protein [Spirochaetaceae bacterium]